MQRPALLCAGLATLWAGCGPQPVSGPDASTAGLDAAAPALDAAAPRPDAAEPPDAAGEPDAGVACWACHGTQASPAPPPDLSGSFDETKPGVGAHAAHLASSTWHGQLKCSHCHVVPAADDAAHGKDAHAATVTFSGLAAAGVTPTYSGGACNVYCHGAAMRWEAGPRTSPAWTTPGALGCTSCHGTPPGAPHPAAADCGRCHLDVSDASGKILSASRHIEGGLSAPKGAHFVHLGGAGGPSYACDACHGGDRYLTKDGKPLATTNVCDGCHPGDVAARKAAWDGWEP